MEGCLSSSDCNFMYHCQQSVCVHDDIFPLTPFTIAVYLFTALACGLCNISGNSMGIFKILILMNLLRYDLDEATGLAQALVVGTAIPNFISIILKKHPNQLSSLVNYNLIFVIIPCTLIGSTVGSLTQNFLPKIVQDVLALLVFSFFIYKFGKKVKDLRSPPPELQESLIESVVVPSNQIFEEDKQSHFGSAQEYLQKSKFLTYQKSFHVPQIVISLIVFLVFELLTFLVQGKLPFYKVGKCELLFALGICLLAGLTVLYLIFIRKILKRKYAQYKRFDLPQQIDLSDDRSYGVIVFGGFIAGFIQGILGMGCGTCIMMVLLSFPIASTSASATSGYQILFTGFASLVQYFINGQVQIFQSVWLIGVCCVLGGLTTIFLYRMIKNANPITVNKLLLIIIICLCAMSIVLMFPTVITTVQDKGWGEMTSIKFKC